MAAISMLKPYPQGYLKMTWWCYRALCPTRPNRGEISSQGEAYSRGPVSQPLGGKTQFSAYPEHFFVIALDCPVDLFQAPLFADPYEVVYEFISETLSMETVMD